MHKFLRNLIFPTLLALPMAGWAACNVNGTSAPATLMVAGFTADIPAGVPGGGFREFKTVETTVSGNARLTCSYNIGNLASIYTSEIGDGALVGPDGSNRYAIPSLSSATSTIYLGFTWTNQPNLYWPYQICFFGNCNYYTDTWNWDPGVRINISIGQIATTNLGTGGRIAAGTIIGTAVMAYGPDAGFKIINFVLSSPIVLRRVGAPTCSVTSPNPIPVSMGNIPVSAFGGVGSTSRTQDFNIALNCANGTGSELTSMYTTLSDNVDPTNVSTTLKPTADSSSTGVAVQILKRGDTTPISFGPDSNNTGNLNQFFVGNYDNGPVNIPLSARYIQTGPISSGSANARATFTMSYR